MQAFVPLAPALEASGTRLIFVAPSSAEQLQEFVAEAAALEVPGALYADPSLAVYKLLKFRRGRFRSLVRPIVAGLNKYGIRGMMEGFRLGMQTSHLAGDSWQQGGTTLLDKSGSILFQHTEEHPVDWPDMSQVFSLVGLSTSSMDYKKALSDWLAAREAQRVQKVSL